MTDQIQSGMMAMMQAMAAQSQVPQVGGKKAQGAEDDFQKMLEQKSQPAKEETKPQQPEKAQKPEEAPEQPARPVENEGQPEDAAAMVKRLAEAGVIPMDAANAYLTQVQQPVQPEQPTLETAPLELGEQPVLLTPEFRQLPDQTTTVQQPLDSMPQEEIQPEQTLEVAQQTEEQPVQQNLALETPVERETAPEEAESLPVEAVQVQQGGEEEEGLETTDLPQNAEPVFRDVKAAPIKVGEAQQPEQSQKADINQQIAGPLNQALAQGQTKVEIHLNPEYLGSVKVEIFQSAEGILRVALTAESSETRGLLEKHAANLQSLLSGREQQTVEVEVQRQQPQEGQNQNHLNEDGRNGQNQQQRRQQRQQDGDGQDFLQKLRLGLAPVESGF